MTTTTSKPRKSRAKCQECKTRVAVWRVGSDGFSAKAGRKVCDAYGCRASATGGYPVTLHAV